MVLFVEAVEPLEIGALLEKVHHLHHWRWALSFIASLNF